jgi:cell division septum initiation protein DivIVA
MTKCDEIQHLDLMIATFGRDSYLGPWLSECRDRIVADITSDLDPRVPMPGEAHREAARILTAARTEADTITRQAAEKASKTIDDARTEARAIRDRARAHLYQLAEKA